MLGQSKQINLLRKGVGVSLSKWYVGACIAPIRQIHKTRNLAKGVVSKEHKIHCGRKPAQNTYHDQ